MLNVGEIVVVDGDTLGSGTVEEIPALQPIETTPIPTPEVGQSSPLAEPTSTDEIGRVKQKITKGDKKITKAAKRPTGVVEDGDQDGGQDDGQDGGQDGGQDAPIGLSSAPAEPTPTDEVGRVKEKTTKADKKITKAAKRPTGVVGDGDQVGDEDAPIGLLNVGQIVRVDGDTLGSGTAEATPNIQPIDPTTTPAAEVSQSDALAEPTSTDEVERVKQKTTKADKKITKAAKRPTGVVEDGDQDGGQDGDQDAPVGLLNVGEIVVVDGDTLGSGSAEATPAIRPIETTHTPAPEVGQSSPLAEPTSADEVGRVKEKTTKADKKTTKAAKRPTGVVEDGDQNGSQDGDRDAPVGLLNVGEIVRIDSDILGNGNAEATPTIQPIESIPTPAPEVNQSSAPAEPTATDEVGRVKETTTKADKKITKAAKRPTGVVEDSDQDRGQDRDQGGNQDTLIGLLNVGETVSDILGSGTAEATPARPVSSTPTPAPEVSQSNASAEPTSTDKAERVKQETTKAAKKITKAAQGPTGGVEKGDQDNGQDRDRNVDKPVKVHGDTPGSGNAPSTSALQPNEVPPAPAPIVSQSSAPSQSTSTDAAEAVVQETTKATEADTGAAQEPTPAVEAAISRLLNRRSLHVEPVFNETTGTMVAVNVTDLTNSGSSEVITIKRTCALALALPHQE